MKTRIVVKREREHWDREKGKRETSLPDYIKEIVAPDDDGYSRPRGTLETVEYKLEQTIDILGRLIEVTVSRGVINIDELKDILNVRFQRHDADFETEAVE